MLPEESRFLLPVTMEVVTIQIDGLSGPCCSLLKRVGKQALEYIQAQVEKAVDLVSLNVLQYALDGQVAQNKQKKEAARIEHDVKLPAGILEAETAAPAGGGEVQLLSSW